MNRSISALRRTLVLGTAASAVSRLAPAFAESAREFPWHTISIVQPYGAGNLLDIYARKFASYLAVSLGQPVIVETRPGASGNIAAEYVARAAPTAIRC